MNVLIAGKVSIFNLVGRWPGSIHDAEEFFIAWLQGRKKERAAPLQEWKLTEMSSEDLTGNSSNTIHAAIIYLV